MLRAPLNLIKTVVGKVKCITALGASIVGDQDARHPLGLPLNAAGKIYRITNGSIDMFSMFLYFIALFTLLLLLFMVRMFDTKQFFISWWAYTFPLAAITISTLLMHMALRTTVTYVGSVILILLTTLVIGFVTYRTILECRAEKICIEEKE